MCLQPEKLSAESKTSVISIHIIMNMVNVHKKNVKLSSSNVISGYISNDYYLKKYTIGWGKEMSLEKWLSNYEHILVLWTTLVQFLSPTMDYSQRPVTSAMRESCLPLTFIDSHLVIHKD